MDLTIHTYGYHDALYYVINGLAMFRNSEFYTTLVNSIALIIGCYYGIRMAYTASKVHWRQYVIKILGMMVMINALLLPKTEMLLKDHVSKTIQKVDNIPLAFALPVGVIENFGQLITAGFEQVFAPIQSVISHDRPVFPYYNYGMMFGARLQKEISQSRIRAPRFVGNMQNFIKQCVALPAMIGRQFTKEELVATNDIWKLVKDRAGTLVRVDITTDSDRNPRTTMTCKEATEYFERKWESAVEGIVYYNRNNDFTKAKASQDYAPPKSVPAVVKIFENNVKALYGGEKPAFDIIRQQMMINSLSDYKSSKYGVARARMQQESSSILSSDLASLYLPMMLVVFKCIIYSAFIFLVPMLLFSGGMSKYTSYITLVASLQLWPSINAVLNMIIGTYTYSNISLGSGLLVSYSTASSVNHKMDSIITIAGGLQIIVPFLAYWMTNLGAGGLMHLAGNIVGSMQSNAGSVGSELSTGNRSLDNDNIGNSQRNMRSSGKIDHNMQYADGIYSTQLGDGGMEKVNADGKVVISSGAGINQSTGDRKFDIRSDRQQQLSKGIQSLSSLLDSDQRSYSDAKSHTFSRAADHIAHIAQREHNGETFNYESMGEQGRALQHAVSNTRQLHEKRGYGWNQAATAGLQTEFSLSTPGKKLAGIGLSGSATGSLSAINSSDQYFDENNSINSDSNVNNNYHNVIKAASNSSWAKENSIDTSYSDAVRGSYEEQQRLETQVSKRSEQLESYHEAQTQLDSQSATQSKDMRPELQREIEKTYKVSSREAHEMIENYDPRVDRIWNNMVASQDNIMPSINEGRNRVQGDNATNELDNFSKTYEGMISRNPGQAIKEQAKQGGLDIDNVKSDVATVGEEIKQNYQEIMTRNDHETNMISKFNNIESRDLKEHIQKLEEDRIGNGIIGSSAATAVGMITGGKAGWNIGAPDKYERKNYNKSTPPGARKESDVNKGSHEKGTQNKLEGE